ncbi:hypothetical protein NEPAR04_2501 [Nematocida parisii]|nr:hypothetical protein NEPAR04_2501 [Nematocida parisii]
MSKSLRKKQLEEDTDATSPPSREYNRGDHGPPGEVDAVLRRINFKKGRGTVERALRFLATPPFTWKDWSAPTKLSHWLFETESRPESEIGDILVESQAQVTRMDKVQEDWTDEDWKEFVEHMLTHIEKKQESVLVKPPRLQDFRAMGAQQYQVWAAVFADYVEAQRYTHSQVLTDMIRYPVNYPKGVKTMWSSFAGDLQAARQELRALCMILDKQQAETRAALGHRPEARREKPYRRFDARDKLQKFIGRCNYCHKPGHKEIACRKKGYDTQRPPKGSYNKTTPSS